MDRSFRSLLYPYVQIFFLHKNLFGLRKKISQHYLYFCAPNKNQNKLATPCILPYLVLQYCPSGWILYPQIYLRYMQHVVRQNAILVGRIMETIRYLVILTHQPCLLVYQQLVLDYKNQEHSVPEKNTNPISQAKTCNSSTAVKNVQKIG